MRILWLVALVAVYLPLIVLISINWNDEKVRDIGFSILLVGGTIGLISVWNSLNSEKRTIEFNSSFIVLKTNPSVSINTWANSQDNVGVTFPEDHLLSIAAQEFYKSYPEEFTEDVQLTYLDIVNYIIIEQLVLSFSQHWLVDVKTSDTEIAKFTRYQTIPAEAEKDAIEWNQIQKVFPSQIFNVEQLNKTLKTFSLKVPKGTKLTLKDTDSSKTISLDNKYAKIEITISFVMYGPGFGKTGLYLNLPDSTNEQFINLSYSIMINSESKKIYSGSLESEHQKTWIKSVENVLRNRLDFSIYLDRVKEWHRLKNLNAK